MNVIVFCSDGIESLSKDVNVVNGLNVFSLGELVEDAMPLMMIESQENETPLSSSLNIVNNSTIEANIQSEVSTKATVSSLIFSNQSLDN